MNRFTPGPWAYYEPSEAERIRDNATNYSPKGKLFRIAGCLKNGGRYVGLLFKSHPNEPDPTEADARLIAAAPDLLDALQLLLELHIAHHNEPEHVKARAAIAKATGEPR